MDKAKPRSAIGRRSTIYDIAAETKASASTVSLVLNGSWSRYRIKEDTARRILQSAQDLGYNVNLKARGLRLSRSGLAGMILPHYRNRFFADLAEAFEAEARQRDLCPIVVSTQRDPEVEVRVTETLLAQQVEFLFIAGVPDPTPLNALCRSAEVACVNLDLPGGDAPSVVSDNVGGARLLTKDLIAKVERRGGVLSDIAYLGGVAGEYATNGRVAGFIAALTERGHRVDEGMLFRCGYPPESACDALAAFAAERGRLPAGILVNSIAAFEGLVAFASRRPETALADLVVACFDWDPFAAHLPYDVTMLRQDVEAMIEQAFAALGEDQQKARGLVMVEPVRV